MPKWMYRVYEPRIRHKESDNKTSKLQMRTDTGNRHEKEEETKKEKERLVTVSSATLRPKKMEKDINARLYKIHCFKRHDESS